MMKKFIVHSCLFASILLSGISAQAQEVKDSIQLFAIQDSTEQKVYDLTEELPEFPGGDSALSAFISKNLKYPVEAMKRNITGKVIVDFILERDGSVTDVHVVKSVHPLLDNEAIRVIKLLPKWIPAKQKGETVCVKFTFPITFKLESDNLWDKLKSIFRKKRTDNPNS